jgi:hypothetical protein
LGAICYAGRYESEFILGALQQLVLAIKFPQFVFGIQLQQFIWW